MPRRAISPQGWGDWLAAPVVMAANILMAVADGLRGSMPHP